MQGFGKLKIGGESRVKKEGGASSHRLMPVVFVLPESGDQGD